MWKFLKPKRTAESLVVELVKGLRDGSIVLDEGSGPLVSEDPVASMRVPVLSQANGPFCSYITVPFSTSRQIPRRLNRGPVRETGSLVVARESRTEVPRHSAL